MGSESIIKKIYCNKCNGETNHKQGATFQYSGEEICDERNTFSWSESWNVWQCRGCDEVTIEKVEHSDADFWDNNGNSIPERTFFPERNIRLLSKKRYIKIPDKLRMIYNEIIESYNKSCFLLCSIGLRTLLEAICNDKGVKGDKLMMKINKSSFLTENIKKNLHGIRHLGNDATHEFTYPSKEDLELTISIIEDILNTVYDLDYKSSLMYNKFDKKSNE